MKEEDKDPRFEVREFLELHMHWGQRRIRIYFTDIAVYLIEYYTGYGMAYFWSAIPIKMLLTPILGEWYRKDFDKMTDIREIMSASHWYRRYAYHEIKKVWMKNGVKKNALYFKIVRDNKGIVTPGFGSGTDYLTFDKNDTEEFKEVLKRRLGDTFKGFR